MKKLFFKSIKSDATFFNKFDGNNKTIELPGSKFNLALNEADMAPYEDKIMYYLEYEGDMNIIHVAIHNNEHDVSINGIFTSKMSLKDSAKQVMNDIFGIRHSSALRNAKDTGTILRFQFLVGADTVILCGVRYSFIKEHSEMFPDIDLPGINNIENLENNNNDSQYSQCPLTDN